MVTSHVHAGLMLKHRRRCGGNQSPGNVYPHGLVVPVIRSCQSPIRIWLVNYLHLHLHLHCAVARSLFCSCPIATVLAGREAHCSWKQRSCRQQSRLTTMHMHVPPMHMHEPGTRVCNTSDGATSASNATAHLQGV